MTNKKLSIFLKLINKYYKLVKDNEMYFDSSKGKEMRSIIIGLLADDSENINILLGSKSRVEINSNHYLNTLSTALSSDYKTAIYCLQILLTTLQEYLGNEKEKEITQNEVLKLIQKGECETVEFKSSMIYPTEIPVVDNSSPKPIEIQKLIADFSKAVRKEVAQVVSAFLNSSGGVLLVGVKNDGEIIGIENDIKHLNDKVKNIDKYDLFFNDLVRLYLDNFARSCVQAEYVELDSKMILVIKVSKSNKPIFLNDIELRTVEFYIRLGPSSSKMNVKESNEYISNHWFR